MRRVWSLLMLGLLFLTRPALADRSFLVGADWLAERIDDPKTVVLEVRYHPHRYFTVGHIHGGRGIWDRAFTLPVVIGENPYDDEFAL
jgi:thiosulfate/3-mercaptopyruvate sulfurtransferase